MFVKKGTGRKPQCHPSRKHYAKGLCASCYHAQAVKRKKKAKHKEPIVVTHTHDVIRQVQQPKKETKMAEKTAEPKKDTQLGYSGSESEGEEPLERPEGASKEAVVSELGATEPTPVFGGDGVTPEGEFRKKYRAAKKKQAAVDAKRRQQAREEADASNMMTTAKGV